MEALREMVRFCRKPSIRLRAVFLGQVTVSTLPTVLAISTFPIFAESVGLSLQSIGIVFLMLRTGALAGAQIAPRVASRIHVNHAAVYTEIFNFSAATLFYFGLTRTLFPLLCIAALMKGICSGMLPNFRTTWLRSSEDQVLSKRILIGVQTLIQSAYGLAGILMIIGLKAKTVPGIIILDALTSLLGAWIFWQMRSLTPVLASPSRGIFRVLREIWVGKCKQLLLLDIGLGIATGGTNVFLIKTGKQLAPTISGYGVSLILYSLAYTTGGLILRGRVRPGKSLWGVARLASMVLTFGAFLLFFSSYGIQLSLALKVLGLFLFCLAMPLVFLSFETLWFDFTSPKDISIIFGFRSMVIGLIWAFCESLYASISYRTEFEMRLVLAASVAFFIWSGSRSTSDG